MRTAAYLLLATVIVVGCNKAEEKPADANAARPEPPPQLKLPPVTPPGPKADPPKPDETVPAVVPPPKAKAKAPVAPPAELLAAITKLNGYEGGFGRAPGEPIHFQFRDPGPTDDDLATLRAPLLNSARPVHLNLNQCSSISDAGVAHLKDIPALRRLSLGGTRVTDVGLKTVGGLDLDELYVSSDAITDAGVAHLAGLTKLRKLGVYSKALTAAAFVHFANMTALEELNTSPYEFDDARLKHMGKLTRLKSITVGGAGLTDAGMEALKGMTELRELRVEGEKVTAAGVAHLAGLTKLQKLTALRGQGFNGDALAAFAGMTELRELEFIYTPAIDKAGGASVGKLKSLKKLRFGAVTADGLAGIAGLTTLEDLDLSYSAVTDDAMKHLTGLTGLKSLNLYATRVTAKGLHHLRTLTALRHLTLSENRLIVDAALAEVAAIPNLEVLWASNCQIEGHGLAAIAKHPKLKELALGGNPITDAHVRALIVSTSLQELNLTGTRVSDAVLFEMKEARPKLRVRDASGAEVTLDKKPAPQPKPKGEDLTKVEPDFKLTAETFYKECEADKAAADRKYRGKVIELSGVMKEHGRNASGDAYVGLKVEGKIIGVMCFTADSAPWAVAVKGQKVKIKGRCPELTVGVTLAHCVFTDTGEYKGIRITAAKLANEFAADSEGTIKKYEDRILVVTGEVVAKEFNSAGAALFQFKVDGKVAVSASFTAAENVVTKPIKVGQTVTVVGEFTLNFADRDDVTVYFCQLMPAKP